MNKKILFFLAAQTVIIHAADKRKDEEKSGAKTTTRYIVEAIHTKPMCEPSRKKTITSKEYAQESSKIIVRYAQVLPAFAELLRKKHGCEYYLSEPFTITLQNGSTYKKITAHCFGCNFKPTFFHVNEQPLLKL